jgi:hypothetical protein
MGSPAPSTSVPFPTLGPAGFVAPDETTQILPGVQSDINNAFGGNLNPALSTPQGQLATSETAIIGDSFAVFTWFCNMTDPAYSVGRMQDAIGRLYFIERIAGQPTIQSCVCAGLNGVTIPIGALAQDPSGNLWVSNGSGVIVNGSVTISFASGLDGPLPGPSTLSIYQGPLGWDSVTPTGDAVLGNDVETPAQFETRRAYSTGLNSMGPLNAVYAAVLAVPGVLDCYVYQNNTASPITAGGVSIGANSIYVCPLGGSQSAVASAIFTRKMPGCAMTGNTTVTVVDPNPAYLTPPPSYQITYEMPAVQPMAVVVKIANSAAVPSNALALVQNAIVNAFAGGDGGPRAKIGSLVLASRYYPPVTAVSNTYNGSTGQVLPGWSAAIVSIQLGADGAAASIVGSISGTTMTVTGVSSGSIANGYLAEGTGFPGGTGPVYVVSQISGSIGGTGAYLLSGSLTVVSGTITFTQLGNDYQTYINQAPACSAVNVYLNLVTS